MAFSDEIYGLHVGISSDSPAGCEIWRNFQARCPFPAAMCHVTALSMRTRQTVGSDSVLLHFDFIRKKKLKKWVCMGDLVHVLYSAFQSNNYSEKDRSHKLEMYPVWPNQGLLLADLWFCFEKKTSIASVSVGENLPKSTNEGQLDSGNFFSLSVFSPESGEAFFSTTI